MSVETQLAKFGITTQQAKDFINSNILNPGEIFQAAKDYGITTEMLGELSGYSVDAVSGYFYSVGENSKNLDYTKIFDKF